MRIDGTEYALFRDYDCGKYRNLTFSGKVQYLEARVERILISPCRAEVKMLGETNRGLILVTVICAGISAASTFFNGRQAYGGEGEKVFVDFVKTYMDPILTERRPKGMESWAQWLYKDVSCGLAHGFTIRDGGFEMELKTYVAVKPYGPEINPGRLLEDLARGWSKYLADVRQGGPGSSLGRRFEARFNRIFHDQAGRTAALPGPA